ncbi:MAG: hypothetical protein VX696_00940 [Pseudomonadota bacterium]|nr:hypothetical protein [Pseudomonadota bacterium]
MMSLDLSTLTKGQTRKLNALRKSLGNEIADAAFAKWMKTQTKEETFQVDPVAEKIKAALSSLEHDKAFRLGSKGYNIKRSKGKGASGFTVSKVE